MELLVRNISDTARWVAVFRVEETERADAVFGDPFARRLGKEENRSPGQSFDIQTVPACQQN